MKDLDSFELMFQNSKIFDENIFPSIVSYLPKLRTSQLLFAPNLEKEKISPMDFHDA